MQCLLLVGCLPDVVVVHVEAICQDVVLRLLFLRGGVISGLGNEHEADDDSVDLAADLRHQQDQSSDHHL